MRKTIAEIIRAARMSANPMSQVGYPEADALIANDVVKVVRCKGCVHYKRGVCYCPEQKYLIVGAKHYCGYGERRGGADND